MLTGQRRMELDEWELSAEELDSIEREALQRIAQQQNSYSISSSSSHLVSFNNQNPQNQNSFVPSEISNPIFCSSSTKVSFHFLFLNQKFLKGHSFFPLNTEKILLLFFVLPNSLLH